jgi:hypothetical protein
MEVLRKWKLQIRTRERDTKIGPAAVHVHGGECGVALATKSETNGEAFMERTPGGYVPRFPVSEPQSSSLMARLKDAHANVIALRREFLARKGSASGSLTSLAEELSTRLKRECLPAVHVGRQRIAELEPRDSSPEVANELDTLAGRRFWNGRRDPLTSAVEVTDTAIELTLDWLRKESGARTF